MDTPPQRSSSGKAAAAAGRWRGRRSDSRGGGAGHGGRYGSAGVAAAGGARFFCRGLALNFFKEAAAVFATVFENGHGVLLVLKTYAGNYIYFQKKIQPKNLGCPRSTRRKANKIKKLCRLETHRFGEFSDFFNLIEFLRGTSCPPWINAFSEFRGKEAES